MPMFFVNMGILSEKFSVKEVHITIPSSTEFVGPIVKFFNEFLSNRKVEDRLTANIITSVIEALANAIKHGNQSRSDKQIEIMMAVNKSSLTIRVHDEGQGFDVAALPDPLDPENLLKPFGRGIFLIKNFMDSVDFKFETTGTTIIMEKQFQQPVESDPLSMTPEAGVR